VCPCMARADIARLSLCATALTPGARKQEMSSSLAFRPRSDAFPRRMRRSLVNLWVIAHHPRQWPLHRACNCHIVAVQCPRCRPMMLCDTPACHSRCTGARDDPRPAHSGGSRQNHSRSRDSETVRQLRRSSPTTTRREPTLDARPAATLASQLARVTGETARRRDVVSLTHGDHRSTAET